MTTFRILSVCTANICRSPVMERLLGLDTLFQTSSAGVRAATGQPMDELAAEQLVRLGGSVDGFTSRLVTEQIVKDTDLILVATRAHRSKILRLSPRALRRTFTLTEFADLVADSSADTPDELVADAARRRGSVSFASESDLDVPDPYGDTKEFHAAVADLIADAVSTIKRQLRACGSASA